MEQKPKAKESRSDWLLRQLGVRRDELSAVFWSGMYYFFLLAGYHVIRPIRDAMGLTGGVRELKWLFMVTLCVMLVVNPIFSAIVSRYPRRIFVPAVYLFFVANLVVFFVLFKLRDPQSDANVARVFFIWGGVFSLLAVSVFWAMMADVFQAEQSQRLFGLIGLGGTVGAIAGSGSTTLLAQKLGEVNLLPISAICLLLACGCVLRTNQLIARRHRDRGDATPADKPSTADSQLGGGMFSGFVNVFRSPYLLAILTFVVFHSFCSTLAYFVQGTVVDQVLSTRESRVAWFASVELTVNCVTAVIQILFTGHAIRRFGIGPMLALLPVVVMMGFFGLGLFPTLGMVFAFQVVRRASEFALTRPARESLFTVVSREDKYKAKNLIDTFAFRGGDAAGAASFSLLTSRWIGLGVSGVLWLCLPIGALWIAVSLFLGRQQKQADAQPSSAHDLGTW
jgi:AAA family ATP:ADP antiporter